MALSDLRLQTSYRKTVCNVANEFYLPCMKNATKYDRLSGYFSSGIYLIIWEALQEFIQNSGKMRLVCSPNLSNEDKEALKLGLDAKSNDILSKSLLNEFEHYLSSDVSNPAKILACLVSQEILEIKLAVHPTESLYHDKVGIFSDSQGNVVGFRGAMNETYKGLAIDGNTESVEVFTNWNGDRDTERTIEAQEAFDEVWDNRVPPVQVFDLPSSVKKRFLEISEHETIPDLLYNIKTEKNLVRKKFDSRKLKRHQAEALDDWKKNNRRGVLEHATGSGKTFTALCAIRDALNRDELPLILVPSTDLLIQWQRELDTSLSDLDPIYLSCGGGNTLWTEHLDNFSSQPDKKKRIILSTIQTAIQPEFLSKINDGNHIFFVADEVHRFGSSEYQKIFSLNSGPRLGLSATPKRYGDPVGTAVILHYFERIINPTYTLKEAISDKVLTEYEYNPIEVELTPDEQSEWEDISKEIRSKYIKLKYSVKNIDEVWANKSIKALQIQRANILKGAANKIDAALHIISKYNEGEKWIVYCDSIQQIHTLKEKISTDSVLSKNPVLEYHSGLVTNERINVMKYFDMNGGILLSVRCLDEGIDIPSVTHALILASSKNPREFIQRRGRILRISPHKSLAYLYDMIVVPCSADDSEETALSITKSELVRAIQFGSMAKNPMCVANLIQIAVEHNINWNEEIEGGYDGDDDE